MSLDISFVKAVSRRISEASSPIYIRELMNKYSNYLFNDEIYSCFLEQIELVYNLRNTDTFSRSALNSISDDLDIERQISLVCSNNVVSTTVAKTGKNTINRVLGASLTKCTDGEKTMLKRVFLDCNGNKIKMCRIFGVSNDFLNKKIEQYTLKEYLNTIRREYRNKSKTRE